MRNRRRHRLRRLLLIAAAMTAVASAVGYAAIPNNQTGVINACFEKKTGFLRVIDAQAGKKCLTQYENPLSWNQQGAPGSVTGVMIQDGTLSAADFTIEDANGLTSANVKNESLSGADVANGSLTDGDIKDGTLKAEEFTTDDANGLNSANVKNESLSGEDLANGSVTSGDIQNGTLDAAEFTTVDAEGLTSANVKDGSLSGDDLAGGSVDTGAIKTNAASTIDLGPGGHGQLLAGGSDTPVAQVSIIIPAGASHLVLVTGQAQVACACTLSSGPELVDWRLVAPTAGNFGVLVYQDWVGPRDNLITSVSRMYTVPAGENTFTLRLRPSGDGVSVEHATLSVIDLGSA